jgi:hypothetical protein
MKIMEILDPDKLREGLLALSHVAIDSGPCDQCGRIDRRANRVCFICLKGTKHDYTR